jgi:hypothetical protein
MSIFSTDEKIEMPATSLRKPPHIPSIHFVFLHALQFAERPTVPHALE